jgi:molybdate transport system substrate-binding protein
MKMKSILTGIRQFSMALAVASAFSVVFTTGNPAQGETLRVGAAHSLKPAFQEFLPMFEKEYGVKVHVVYAPSQTLRRQIEEGNSIDVFLPEAAEELDILDKKGFTLNGGPRIYAQTSLVLVMSAGSPVTMTTFRDGRTKQRIRMAIADPATSRLGKITARVLKKLNPTYRNRLDLLQAQHSDDILNLVRTGKVDMGIVYRVDALNGGQVRIINETLAGMRTPVHFGQAVIGAGQDQSPRVAKEFFDFIISPRIQKLLVHYGFESIPSSR